MKDLLNIQNKITKALEELKGKDLENFSVKAGNLESLIHATKTSEDEGSGEITKALGDVHSVLDELNNYALQLLQNVDHKIVEVRHDKPKPIKKVNR